MDSTRFDALTRSLATAKSRRAFVRAAIATVSAGIGGALSHPSVQADDCKSDGKRCKKHGQCCSGVCAPGPTAESTSTSDSVCCTPHADESTCGGRCGPQVNNCGETIDCGSCLGDPCARDGDCASDNCCEATCIDCSSVSETATNCNGCDTCCECFEGDNFGPPYCCTDPTQICGTYPNDVCCANQLECVDGACVNPVYICPHEIGREPVDCRGVNGAGCCGGVCCPLDKPVCLNGACHASLPTCTAGAPTCPAGSTCTANKWNPNGVCCANMGTWMPGNRDENGDLIVVNVCCELNQKWGNDDNFGLCPTCVAKDHCGCTGPCTSRTSTPRIG